MTRGSGEEYLDIMRARDQEAMKAEGPARLLDEVCRACSHARPVFALAIMETGKRASFGRSR
jgi:hypothetical protein